MMANWDGKHKKSKENHTQRLAIAYDKVSAQKGVVDLAKQIEFNVVQRV